MRRSCLLCLLAIAGGTVQVAQPGYWDKVYAESQRLNVTDFKASWQGVSLQQLQKVLDSRLQLRQDLRIVVLGSGDSALPEEIHEQGVADVTAVDISPTLCKASRSVRCLTEDARAQMSLAASSVDVIFELGLLDVILSEADLDGAAGLLREARRLLRAGGLFVSASTDIPKFRLPLLAEHPAGGWAKAEVLRVDRLKDLDPRVKELDPDWEVEKIFIYVNLAAGQVHVGQDNGPWVQPAAAEATASQEAPPSPPVSHAPEDAAAFEDVPAAPTKAAFEEVAPLSPPVSELPEDTAASLENAPAAEAAGLEKEVSPSPPVPQPPKDTAAVSPEDAPIPAQARGSVPPSPPLPPAPREAAPSPEHALAAAEAAAVEGVVPPAPPGPPRDAAASGQDAVPPLPAGLETAASEEVVPPAPPVPPRDAAASGQDAVPPLHAGLEAAASEEVPPSPPVPPTNTASSGQDAVPPLHAGLEAAASEEVAPSPPVPPTNAASSGQDAVPPLLAELEAAASEEVVPPPPVPPAPMDAATSPESASAAAEAAEAVVEDVVPREPPSQHAEIDANDAFAESIRLLRAQAAALAAS